MVNHYGQLAAEHWRAHRPHAYRALPEPERFFQALGEQVQAAITSLRGDLLARTPDLALPELRTRAAQAMAQAEEIVLAELVWVAAEPTPSEPDPVLDRYYQALEVANTAITADPAT